MPRMYDWLVTALNEHNTPISVALIHPGFNLLDRQRLKNWQTRFYRQYDASKLLQSLADKLRGRQTSAFREKRLSALRYGRKPAMPRLTLNRP